MRILVVDDDASVVQALLAALKTAPGHEIRAALSGAKAIENAAAWGGIDLLISDVVMEPMDGFTLRDQLLQRYPAMQTIFVSGYDLSDYPEQTQHHQILTKPIDAAALFEAVNRETERAAAAASVAALPTARPSVAIPSAVPAPIAVPGGPARIASPAPAARPAAAVVASQPRVGPSAAPTVAAKATPGVRPPVAVPTARPGTVPQPAVPPRATVPQPVGRPVAAAPESATSAGGGATNNSAAPRTEEPPAQEALAADSAAPTDDLIGQTLGPYRVTGRLSKGEISSAYTAVQVTINRPVVLKILDPEQQLHEPTKRRFIADARAKAHVQHPSIVSVYEAGEGAGRIIYAREYVDGQNLEELQASGARIDEATALKMMRVVAEGMAYLRANNIPHAALEPASIYLASDGQPRLANLSTQFSENPRTIEQEMQVLARIMLSVLPAAQQLSTGLRTLLGRMAQAPATRLNTWDLLLQGLKALEPKFVPVEAAMISAQDRAAIQAVDLARRQQRRSLWLNIASLSTLFAIVVGLILWKFVFTNERKIQGEVLIPAGTYKIASGRTVEIAQPFLIDTYEVTFAQYGRFLKYLREHPTADQDFRHPRMPKSITSHVPEHWDIYFLNAKAGGKARSIPIDLNCPVMTVTWWDAYAYASWLGRDLPTAEEWEVAATGGKKQRYPWGDEPIASKANSGADHHPDPRVKAGKIDGYSFWNPVDAIRGDKSPFGVVGMAGNVAEWTGSWTPERRPIIKGGSYLDADVPLDKQIVDADPSKGEEHIGFRTIKRNPTK